MLQQLSRAYLSQILFTSIGMHKELRTEIHIQARPETVWSIVCALDEYPKWNPFIIAISGVLAVGRSIQVRIKPVDSSAMNFRPTILVCDKNKELRWLGRFLVPGLFDGEHCFELIDNGDHSTTFRQSEKFKGVLVGLFNLDNTLRGFEEMNTALKDRAEAHEVKP